MNSFKILQFNCRGLSNKAIEIMEMAENDEISIMCLNEARRWKSSVISPNYYIASSTDESRHHGSLIMVRKGLETVEVKPAIVKEGENGKVLELLRIKVRLTINSFLWVTSVYNSPDLPLDPLGIFDVSLENHIILGDFNSPHEDLNCNYNSENGQKMVNFIESQQHFRLLNNGYGTNTHNNMIDLHFCDESLHKYFSDFEVLDDYGSDHKVTVSKLCLNPQLNFFISGRIDFNKFRINCTKHYRNSKLYPPEIPKLWQIDDQSTEIVKIIQNSIKEAEESKKIFTNSIDQNIRELIRRRKKLRRQTNTETDEHVQSALRKEVNYVGKQIQKQLGEAKEKKMTDMIERARTNNGKSFWKAVKELTKTGDSKSNQNVSVVEYDNFIAKTDKAKADLYAKMLQDTMRQPKPRNYAEAQKTAKINRESKNFLSDRRNLFKDRPRPIFIRKSEINRHLSNKSNTAPGPDNLTYKILRNLPDCMKSYLALLITSSINNGHTPANWREASITMIPKAGKDLKQATNYRPISLTNCIGKLAEICVKERLVHFCEQNDIFGDNQSAYRANRSSTDNLLTLTQYVAEGFQASEVTGLVCLDVEKAFDAVWRFGLLNKMRELKFDPRYIFWVNSFLSRRSLVVKVNSFNSFTFSPDAGVPQGSVVAPILFLIHVAKPPVTEAKVSQFADDFGLYYRSKSAKLLQLKLQRALNELINWCHEMKIKINPQKTKFMIFKITRARRADIKLTIDNQKLEQVNELKFLGLTFTENLNWNKHCEHLIKKANRRIYQLYKLRYAGFSSRNLVLIYKTWIRPLFTYANAAWIAVSSKMSNKLQLVQNKALRACLNQPSYSRVTDLHKITKVEPLKQFQQKLADRYIQRAIENNNPVSSLVSNQRLSPRLKSVTTPLSLLNYT